MRTASSAHIRCRANFPLLYKFRIDLIMIHILTHQCYGYGHYQLTNSLIGQTNISWCPTTCQTRQIIHFSSDWFGHSAGRLFGITTGSVTFILVAISYCWPCHLGRCGPWRQRMLTTGTIETFATAILLQLGLRRWNVLQAVAAKMRIHLKQSMFGF